MKDYHCRKCRRWLFQSDATYGRLTLTCSDSQCKTRQTILLGGDRSRDGESFYRPRSTTDPPPPQQRETLTASV